MENTIQEAEHFVTFYQDQDGNSFVGNRLFVARMLREYGKKLTISNHAASVSPKLVLPELKPMPRLNDTEYTERRVWNECIEQIKRLNPSLFK